ncbi:hypothetical protein PM082_019641 [Marasmius tenuissimus]|nr:hypothetical protein PM082_019641 [Marasmius tenuissimus]
MHSASTAQSALGSTFKTFTGPSIRHVVASDQLISLWRRTAENLTGKHLTQRQSYRMKMQYQTFPHPSRAQNDM